MMNRKQQTLEAIQQCLEIGYTKEELREKLLVKRQERRMNRLKELIPDFLNGEVKTQREYGLQFSISVSIIAYDFGLICRKAKWLIRHYETEEYWKGVEKDLDEKERLTDYFINGPLNTRIINALYRAGFKSAAEVYNFDFENKYIRGLGRSCYERIEEFKRSYEKAH